MKVSFSKQPCQFLLFQDYWTFSPAWDDVSLLFWFSFPYSRWALFHEHVGHLYVFFRGNVFLSRTVFLSSISCISSDLIFSPYKLGKLQKFLNIFILLFFSDRSGKISSTRLFILISQNKLLNDCSKQVYWLFHSLIILHRSVRKGLLFLRPRHFQEELDKCENTVSGNDYN